MTTKEYHEQLNASDDIRGDAKLIIEHLQSLDFYGWVALLREFGKEPNRLAQVFPVDRGGDILSSASVFLDLLSDHTKQLLGRAATSVLNEATIEVATLRSILVLATVLHLRIDTALLKRLVTHQDIDAATRASAASLLAMNRHDPPAGFWEGLDFGRHPELLAIAVTALTATDPPRAMQLLRSVASAPHVESSLEYPIRRLLRRLPEKVAPTRRDLVTLFPEWLRNTVEETLHEPEFQGRFSFPAKNGVVQSIDAQKVTSGTYAESALGLIREFLQALEERVLSPAETLSRFVQLAPSWLQIAANDQGRSLADVIGDLIRAGPINLADAQELANQQGRFRNLREVWVLAQHPLDLDSKFFYSMVRHNIHERFVQYYYFLPEVEVFKRLHKRLVADIGNEEHVNAHIHCIKVHPLAFAINQGCGLLIPEPIENMEGVLVTALTADGKIKGTRGMLLDEMRRVYVLLRSLIEAKFLRELPRLPEELAMPRIMGLEELVKGSIRIN